jgi:hypothetical integral membrane protein (TIGR02206 family)
VRQFSDQHLAALAVMVLLAIACVWTARRHPGGCATWICRLLAVAIFAGWFGEYMADVVEGIYSARYTLPLQLTDLISVTAIAALLTRRRRLVELTYYWAFTATLQATITPDLASAFPNVFYFTYFIYHVGAIVAACVLVFGLRILPRPGAWWRTFAVTVLWAAVAGTADFVTGGNYMYLRTKPVHASLLSALGPWPWYLVGAGAVGIVMMLLLEALTRAGVAIAERSRPPTPDARAARAATRVQSRWSR